MDMINNRNCSGGNWMGSKQGGDGVFCLVILLKKTFLNFFKIFGATPLLLINGVWSCEEMVESVVWLGYLGRKRVICGHNSKPT